jgi:putative DNA primase/helicase
MLSEVLKYAERGWYVIPVDDKKHPLTRNGVKDATRDPAVIQGWWAQWPKANVAIATGQGSKLTVIDLDTKGGGLTNWTTIVQDHGGVPTTLQSSTPSGGAHNYWLPPDFLVRNSVSTLAPGVDVRGERGYVLAPPSILPNGPYRWVDPTVEPQPMPEWLAQMLNTASHTGIPTGDILEGMPLGRRDIAAFALARRLRAAGVPKDMVHRMVSMAAANADPPLDPSIAAEKVDRVFRQFNKQYPLSDKGNADRLIDRHGDILLRLMAGESGSWAVYQDGYWQVVSPDVVTYYALENTEAILSEALALPMGTDEERARRSQYIAYALKCQGYDRISSAVKLAATNQAIMAARGSMDPDPLLLNCPNGTLDLRTGDLRAHKADDYISRSTTVPYDPTALSPRWEAQMAKLFPNPEVGHFVRRGLGYSITGLTREQVMFFAYGTGANGKSTVIRTVHKILGGYSRVGTQDILTITSNEIHPASIADLVGARFVPTGEIEANRWLAEAQLKNMTGGDPVKARFLYKDHFEYDPQYKIWMMGNHKPAIRGTDPGIWRRILMVPFTVRITDEERVPGYEDILLAEEAPGILAWLVRAYLEYQSQGLNPPPAVREATQRYREDEDLVGEFRTMAIEYEPKVRLNATEAYIAYSNHCRLSNERPLTLRKFNAALEEAGLTYTRGTANQKYWLDTRLTQSGRDLLSMGAGAIEVSTFRNGN